MRTLIKFFTKPYFFILKYFSYNSYILFLLIFLSCSCRLSSQKSDVQKYIYSEFEKGHFNKLELIADSLNKINSTDKKIVFQIDSLRQIALRIKLDFSYSESKIDSLLRKRIGEYTREQKKEWENKNWLEFRMIDGNKMYFSRSVSNLKLMLNHENLKTASAQFSSDLDKFCVLQAKKVIDLTNLSGKPVNPVDMKITYRMILKPNQVPEGEIIRCWMPWPKENHGRQKLVEIIHISPQKYIIASDSFGHRSIYFEKQAQKDSATVFEVNFKYQSSAEYVDLSKAKILPYNKESELYKKNTSQIAPHLIFTDQIRKLTDSIVGSSKDPRDVVKKIYYWINNHIPWAGALEYSIMPYIPGYVLANRRGDCGMQTLLFMSMTRYKGIPVKWQSGWMMHPNEVNLHDWSEVYYEGVGWVPLDMSFNLQNSDDLKVKEFYISGIDAYRFIVNDDFAAKFYPEKKYLRSEPIDFQRGEMEWKGGNLYFNQWTYKMGVEYAK